MKSVRDKLLSKTRKLISLSLAPVRQSLKERKAWHRFNSSLRAYKQLAQEKASASDSVESIVLYPCIWDATSVTPIEPSYFYQDSWAFDLVVKAKPKSHIDIGSHHKYVALLSKVVPLTMVDLRPLSLEMESIRFVQGTILDLPFPDSSIESLSSLCVIEHIGLGRYGDPLDPVGSLKACNELARVMKPGGNLYVSVPIEDNPKTYFNAHRSFNEAWFLSQFSHFSVQDKAYIYGASFTNQKRSCFGIGCYHLTK
jgi:SAM-dependent methyltransferase